MNLTKYKEKRNFEHTPEPTGGQTTANELVFVVQQHHSSTMHYDFRLEMDGVLKSWAIPKGPSIDPSVKRLAMMVEDHPYDYKDFEGVIAEGNYGAGTVIIWEKGTYKPTEPIKGKKAMEKHLLQQLEEGALKFRLHGQKLHGEFVLVKTTMAKNSWLLIKHNDEFAGTGDVTENDKSVVSGKILDQLKNLIPPKNRSGSAAPESGDPASETASNSI